MARVYTATALLVAVLTPRTCQASCFCRSPPGSACSLAGHLMVSSTPGAFPVDSSHCDLTYDKEQFQERPHILYPAAKPGHTYTVVMLDPDAPNRTLGQFYLHWIQANIPGEDFQTGNLERSTEITSYLGPAPPEGTGLHRYMFFVYLHLSPWSRVTRVIGDPERQYFTVSEWLQETATRGVLLCGPRSGTQFRAGF